MSVGNIQGGSSAPVQLPQDTLQAILASCRLRPGQHHADLSRFTADQLTVARAHPQCDAVARLLIDERLGELRGTPVRATGPLTSLDGLQVRRFDGDFSASSGVRPPEPVGMQNESEAQTESASASVASSRGGGTTEPTVVVDQLPRVSARWPDLHLDPGFAALSERDQRVLCYLEDQVGRDARTLDATRSAVFQMDQAVLAGSFDRLGAMYLLMSPGGFQAFVDSRSPRALGRRSTTGPLLATVVRTLQARPANAPPLPAHTLGHAVQPFVARQSSSGASNVSVVTDIATQAFRQLFERIEGPMD